MLTMVIVLYICKMYQRSHNEQSRHTATVNWLCPEQAAQCIRPSSELDLQSGFSSDDALEKLSSCLSMHIINVDTSMVLRDANALQFESIPAGQGRAACDALHSKPQRPSEHLRQDSYLDGPALTAFCML